MALTTDWLKIRARAEALPAAPRVDDETALFLRALRPATLDYHSPLNPVFVVGLRSAEALRGAGAWLARDGAVPLAHFFASCPRPGRFRGVLYVHRSAAAVVPPAWRASVRLYEIVSRSLLEPEAEPSRVLVCGLATPLYQSLDGSRSLLARIERAIAAAVREASEVVCFIPRQYLAWELEDRATDWALEALRLCRKHSRRVRLYSQDDFHDGNTSLRDWRVLELNERLLVADSAIVHAFLRRGASLPREAELAGHDPAYMPLSPYHGVASSEWREPADLSYARRIERLLEAPTRQLYPWSD